MKGSLKVKKLSWIVRKMSSDQDLPKVGALYLKESLSDVKFTAPNKYDQTVKSIKSNFPNENGGDPMDAKNFVKDNVKIAEGKRKTQET